MKQQKERSYVNLAFIILFLVILYAPAVQQYFNIPPLTPVVESRTKVPLPPGNPVAELWTGHGYFFEYEKHFNDVFGYRDFFIRLRNQIQYSLFGDSDQVIVGRNGWLADKSSIEVEQRAVDTLSDAQWARLGDRLAHLDRILHQRGIYLLLIPIPIKNTVYPENFPAAAARRPAVTGYAKFTRLLADRGVPFIDVYKILSQKRRSVPVYYRTDMHWNTVGAATVAAEAVDRLGREMHRDVRWRYPDSPTLQPFAGGIENNLLALLWPLTDIEPQAALHASTCGETVKLAAYDEFVNRCQGPTLPQTIMFGNSFTQQMLAAGFQNHFAKLYTFYDLTEFPKLLTDIKPGTRIVIWQSFELEIAYQMQNDDWWRQVDDLR